METIYIFIIVTAFKLFFIKLLFTLTSTDNWLYRKGKHDAIPDKKIYKMFPFMVRLVETARIRKFFNGHSFKMYEKPNNNVHQLNKIIGWTQSFSPHSESAILCWNVIDGKFGLYVMQHSKKPWNEYWGYLFNSEFRPKFIQTACLAKFDLEDTVLFRLEKGDIYYLWLSVNDYTDKIPLLCLDPKKSIKLALLSFYGGVNTPSSNLRFKLVNL